MQAFSELFEYPLYKVMAGVVMSVMATPENFPVILGALFLLDIATGLRTARRNKQPITASKLSNAFVKATDYLIFIIAVTVFTKLHGTLEIFLTIAYVFIGLTYLKSIAENVADSKFNANHPISMLMLKLREMNPFGFFDTEEKEKK